MGNNDRYEYDSFSTYCIEMRPYRPGENLNNVDIGDYRPAGDMGMIARDPKDHTDQWYVPNQHYNEIFGRISTLRRRKSPFLGQNILIKETGDYLITVEYLVLRESEEEIAAHCKQLSLAGYGRNKREASASLILAVTDMIEYAIHNHTIVPMLKQLGWNTERKPYTCGQDYIEVK